MPDQKADILSSYLLFFNKPPNRLHEVVQINAGASLEVFGTLLRLLFSLKVLPVMQPMQVL
jgi:hypothetical protein